MGNGKNEKMDVAISKRAKGISLIRKQKTVGGRRRGGSIAA